MIRSLTITPIWTVGTPGSGERFGIVEDISITARDVASVIKETLESSSFPGGTIREVSKHGIRVIPEWRIPPVGEVDGQMASGSDVPPEAIERALAPILAVTAREKALDS